MPLPMSPIDNMPTLKLSLFDAILPSSDQSTGC